MYGRPLEINIIYTDMVLSLDFIPKGCTWDETRMKSDEHESVEIPFQTNMKSIVAYVEVGDS